MKVFLSRMKLLSLLIVAATTALTTGCRRVPALIDHVSFTPSQDLETVQVSLVFSSQIRAGLSGNYPVGNYGQLLVSPYTETQPFQVGFTLQTQIFNDQDLLKLTPTRVLPNGVAIGVDTPLVQIQGKLPASSQFDLYGYVDVLKGSWLGMAALFNFMNDPYFPNGLTVSQTFLRDSAGNPGIMASVFGPSVDTAGNLTRAGGVALFANIKQLIENNTLQPGGPTLTFYSNELPEISGPRAVEFRGNYKKLNRLQKRFIQVMNQY